MIFAKSSGLPWKAHGVYIQTIPNLESSVQSRAFIPASEVVSMHKLSQKDPKGSNR